MPVADDNPVIEFRWQEDAMTWIEATCPTCGAVEVTPGDIELGVCSNHSASSFYAFTCPVCNEDIKKKAEDRVVELLVAEGVKPSHWSLPAEVLEARVGPPISIDDVLDFHIMLEQPGWLEELVQKAS